MPIDYYRNSAIEWDRTEGIGAASLAALGIGVFCVLVALLSHSGWPIVIGVSGIVGGILGMIQGLYDVVVYLADPESGSFIVRRIVWRKIDEEFTLPLNEIECFEVQRQDDERWKGDGVSTRIVAKMKSGNRIPLIKEFSSRDLFRKSATLNGKLRELREQMLK